MHLFVFACHFAASMFLCCRFIELCYHGTIPVPFPHWVIAVFVPPLCAFASQCTFDVFSHLTPAALWGHTLFHHVANTSCVKAGNGALGVIALWEFSANECNQLKTCEPSCFVVRLGATVAALCKKKKHNHWISRTGKNMRQSSAALACGHGYGDTATWQCKQLCNSKQILTFLCLLVLPYCIFAFLFFKETLTLYL